MVVSEAKTSWIALFFFIMGIAIGIIAMGARYHQMAVNLGHAEYYLDDDYDRQWRWLPSCKESEADRE